MFRYAFSAAAAIAITFGTVSVLNAKTTSDSYKVSVDKNGRYCVQIPPMTGSRVASTQCRTQENWAKDGVTFTYLQKTALRK